MMDETLYKVLTPQQLMHILHTDNTKFLPINIQKDYHKKLKTNLLTPSRNQNYSCCVEYMLRWFYSKFPDGFFRQKHLDAEHIFQQRRSYRFRDLLVINKPAAAVRVNLDTSYNRQLLDQYNYGHTMYNNRTSYKDAFFRDYDNNLFISMNLEMLLLRFTFRMIFPNQGIQMDVANRCNLIFRAGATQKHFNDVDFHIPTELVNQLAEDNGQFVCPISNKIRDAHTFVTFFNQHSSLPLYYKFDASKHIMQYFLRVPRCLIHIKTDPMQVDEGRDVGNIKDNYGVEFNCEVRFPAPKFYAYYSIKTRQQTQCMSKLDAKSFGVMVSSLARVPVKNDKGWNRAIETDYKLNTEEAKRGINKIHFFEIVEGISDVIESVKSMALSPEVFLDVKVYSYFKQVPCTIDWINYDINLAETIHESCYIIIYMDSTYYAEHLTVIKNYYDTRIQPTDQIIEHQENKLTKDNLNRSSLGRDEDRVVEKVETDDKNNQ